jgi:electron-transferring-flavoprotein dehydrogenase
MPPILPVRYQPVLPEPRLILRDTPDAEAVPMDVLIVGGGPAGLACACAIELARLVKQNGEQGGPLGETQIAVLEKAPALGEHSLSGAVVNPVAMRALFPDLTDDQFPFRTRVNSERVYMLTSGRAQRLPTPPTMKNHGY